VHTSCAVAENSVVDALEVPRAIDEVAVDKRKQAAAGELVVVATDRPAPPLLVDPPAVAYLDLLARACPAQTAGLAGGVEVDVDNGMVAKQASHPRSRRGA